MNQLDGDGAFTDGPGHPLDGAMPDLTLPDEVNGTTGHLSQGVAMTTKAAFSPEEWTAVLQGPPSAGIIVVAAASGGTFRETIAIPKAYAEARAMHGQSELLDEIVAAKPKVDRTRHHSSEELTNAGLQHLRTAVALLESKATPDEVDEYRRFILTLANKVAAAHREEGQNVSPAEADAIDQIAEALAMKES